MSAWVLQKTNFWPFQPSEGEGKVARNPESRKGNGTMIIKKTAGGGKEKACHSKWIRRVKGGGTYLPKGTFHLGGSKGGSIPAFKDLLGVTLCEDKWVTRKTAPLRGH